MAVKSDHGTNLDQAQSGKNSSGGTNIPVELEGDEILSNPEAQNTESSPQQSPQSPVNNESGAQQTADTGLLQPGEEDGITLTQDTVQGGEAESSAEENFLGDDAAIGDQNQDQILITEDEAEETEELTEVQQQPNTFTDSTNADAFTQDISASGSSDMVDYITEQEGSSNYSEIQSSLDQLLTAASVSDEDVSSEGTIEISQPLADALHGLRSAIDNYQNSYENYMSQSGDVQEAKAELDSLNSQLVDQFTQSEDLLGISSSDIDQFSEGDPSALANILGAIQNATPGHQDDIGEPKPP